MNATAATTPSDIADLLDAELDDLDCPASTEQIMWSGAFVAAALDQAPGQATDDDIEDTIYDAAMYLLADLPVRIRTLLGRHLCPTAAGRAWARIRNGSTEELVTPALTRAARDLGALLLG